MSAIFPASTKAGGQCFGAPDVCLTPAPPAPPIPIPYPNFGMVNQAKKTSTKVKFSGKAVVTKKSEMSRSTGDEPGIKGGVISGVNMGKVDYKKGSSKIKIQGQDCIHLTSMTGQNKGNIVGAQIAPSQTKVIISP